MSLAAISLQLPWNSCPLECFSWHQIYELSFVIQASFILIFCIFYDCFCIGTFAELAPHRWFGLWHILIAMNPWVQLLGCDELHNTCAIQCTDKKIFLIPQMTWETDTRKELHLTEQPLARMCLSWRTCPYFEGWWSMESRPGNHPTTLRHIYFCCYLVHFILVWFVSCS